MKLSEDPDHLEWARALADSDFRAALSANDRAIARARTLGLPDMVGFLLRCEATIHRQMGDFNTAWNCYKKSELEHSDSFLPKLQTIEFLVEEKRNAEALNACEAAIAWGNAQSIGTSGSQKYWKDKIEAIRLQLSGRPPGP